MLKFKEDEGTGKGRGFASMDPQKAEAARRKGGMTVSKDRKHMAEIGKKGGQHSHREK